MKIKRLEGMKFSRLLVVSFAEIRKQKSYWNCLCDCGTTIVLSNNTLSRGNTRSCGCLRKELNTRHGMSRTNMYNDWAQMVQRCINPNDKAYPRYGGRGISVCDQWMDFKNFVEDMGIKPEGMEIDRINNDGNYQPNNCRWATRKENCNNRSTTQFVVYQGKTYLLLELARQFGISASGLLYRIKEQWPENELSYQLHQRRGIRLSKRTQIQEASK